MRGARVLRRRRRVSVAYHSPLPPERSGIADYSALLLPALGERVVVRAARRRLPSPRADVALYHVGNDPRHHGWILRRLRRRPGIVVLHDFVVHHLVAGTTLARGDARGYLDALEREGGLAARLLGYAVMEKRIPALWESRPEEFPLAREVLDHATMLVVHSAYVEERARATGYDGPIRRIPHPAWPVEEVTPADVAGEPLFGAFGNVNVSKRIPQLLEAFARVRAVRPGARLLLVGAESPGFDLERRMHRLGLDAEGLSREPYVDEERLWSLMAACDAIASLRAPTMGETSGTAIRALSLGKPLVVSDVGWFSELPDDVALKAPAGEGETEALAASMLALADPTVRDAMGSAARELVQREHDLGRIADLYAAAVEEAAGGELVREAVGRELSAAGAEVGLEPDGREATDLARRLAEVGLDD